MSRWLISIEVYDEDAEWLLAYLANAKHEKARRIKDAIEVALLEKEQ